MRRTGYHAQYWKRAVRQTRCERRAVTRAARTPPPAVARRADSRTIESKEKTRASVREDEAAHGSRDENEQRRKLKRRRSDETKPHERSG
ncbi:hypothetical protein WS70_27095 [Burkholderia mayonis]|uniref:Uncharacterized protein n=1 Tax=Burkholderia mayonis TaxID=1385591 RepID=A0A1B4FNX3_9BURK|nr:hypothetical protein WS70_27095 [Burkholderia mayonis]KVE37391.1 hypothetical protein WS69_10970 [Burkholderia sp. BDU5]KVE47926.1 hypothetical protein WS70_25665 [Burkholderia mayonis]